MTTPKSRAQEALDQMDPLHFGKGDNNELPMKAWAYLCANGPAIIEALELSAALERVPEELILRIMKTETNEWRCHVDEVGVFHEATDGKKLTAAILAAVEKMDKK